MNGKFETPYNVRLVLPDNPDYIAFMRRMADRRPGRGGPRAAGEFLGGLVEQCVRHWLGGFVALSPERILAFEQRQRSGRHATLYREIDAVWEIDAESLCLFEMKLTTPENMERGAGLKQLDISTSTLFQAGRYKYILKRVVYVSAEPVIVLDGLPVLEANDEYEEVGVIWVPPAAVEEASHRLEIELPGNWLEVEAREGTVEDPEREAWREFAGVEPDEAEAQGEDNPLANALRRALGNQNP